MCGIVGMAGPTRENKWAETHRILTHLLLAAEVRGKDAVGYVARPESLEGASQRSYIVRKEPLPPSKFIETRQWQLLRRRRCSLVLAHIRMATHGSPEKAINNHPHVSGHLALMHNGVLSNHRDLATNTTFALNRNAIAKCCCGSLRGRRIQHLDYPFACSNVPVPSWSMTTAAIAFGWVATRVGHCGSDG